jgi:hypothetical protein
MSNQDDQGTTGKIRTADELEQEITTILRHLPIALTITRRDVDRYAWQWLEAEGEGDSFVNALENALTHIETAYMTARKS